MCEHEPRLIHWTGYDEWRCSKCGAVLAVKATVPLVPEAGS